MIRRALSHLLDLTSLARAVHHLARERDALAALAGQLEDELQHATDTAEALRAELADRTAPRDAASPEAEVLRLAYRADRSWRDDVEGPALRQQLQAAEVELAAARAEVAAVRADLQLEKRAHERTWDHKARMIDERDRLQRRLDRRGLTVTRLVTALRRIRRVHAPDVLRAMLLDVVPGDAPPDSTQDVEREVCICERGCAAGEGCRWVEYPDAPPPTQPSERRPIEPAPERAVRVAVSS